MDGSALNPADADFMRLALNEAIKAFDQEEVPIGCVIARGGQVIGRGYNLREKLKDPTAHAEMIAITAAAEAVGDWRLDDCTLYVTLEPCPMCAGAIEQQGIARGVRRSRSQGRGLWKPVQSGTGFALKSSRGTRFRRDGRGLRRDVEGVLPRATQIRWRVEMNTQKMYGRVRMNKLKKGGKITKRWKRNKKLRGRSRVR